MGSPSLSRAHARGPWSILELAEWAFELAESNVRDWPEGERRVRAARRAVMSRFRGKRRRCAPPRDVEFTAELLVRVFDADLELGTTETIAILDALGLPTDTVPLAPHNLRNAA